MSAPVKSVAIVFATDEAYAGLAKDLVASINERVRPFRQVEVVCLDIGLSDASRRWFEAQHVAVEIAKLQRLPEALRPIAEAKRYMLAQLYRPYLPELAPEADLIVHIDCDAWIQNHEFFDVFVAATGANPQNILLAPSVSHYYSLFYGNMSEVLDMYANWTFGCYEKKTADALSKLPFFSSGVFAATPSSPVWRRWEAEILRIVPLVALVNPAVLHLAEQTALNGVVRMDASVTVVDPLYNFHCNAGGVERNAASGKVMASLAWPPREIGVVHLANWRLLQKDYLGARLTYRPEAPPQTV